MPAERRAVVIEEFGPPEVMQLVREPLPEPGPGEALVAVEAAGVNFADVLMRRGQYRRDQQLPARLGIEATGRVLACGEGVALAPGTPVACFLEEAGGYATHLVAPAGHLCPLPAGSSTIDAAALFIQGVTAWYALHRYGRLREGDWALVHAAAGGVGGLAVQLARAAGARIVATASTAAKAETARARGADVALVADPASLTERVREATDGHGVDVVVDGVGGDLFGPSFEALARGGRYVVAGAASQAPSPIDVRRLMPRGQTIAGFIIRRVMDEDPAEPGAALAAVLELHRAGRLRAEVTELPLEHAAEAHRLIESRAHTGKLVLRIG